MRKKSKKTFAINVAVKYSKQNKDEPIRNNKGGARVSFPIGNRRINARTRTGVNVKPEATANQGR
jgi:hypothetical protein